MCRKDLDLYTYPRGICEKVLFKKGFYTHFKYLQPYQIEHTSSCLITAVKQHWAESSPRTFFSVYQLCKIPYKKIFPLYLHYAHHLKRKSTYMTQRKKINKTNTIEL